MPDPANPSVAEDPVVEGARRRQYARDGSGFEVAESVELMGGPPIPAEARAELLVIKSGGSFLCARPDGDIRAPAAGGEGLYWRDTRVLSELALSFGAVEPVLQPHSVESGYCAVVHATNPALITGADRSVPQETLNLRRTLLIDDGRLYVSVELRSFHALPVTIPIELASRPTSLTSSRCAASASGPRAGV